MTIKELKHYLSTLDTEYDEYEITYQTIDETWCYDTPIYSLHINSELKQLSILDEENFQKMQEELNKQLEIDKILNESENEEGTN